MRSWLPPLREGPSRVHPPSRCQVLHTAMVGMGATISLRTGLSGAHHRDGTLSGAKLVQVVLTVVPKSNLAPQSLSDL